MISKSKRNLYIGIIAACILGSFAVFTMIKPDLEPTDIVFEPASSMSGTPGVFPQTSQFDLSVFEADKFKLLKPYTPLTVTESEIGRDDPFKPY